MFMRRRRPLLGAAMLGGTAIAAHRAGERRAMEEQEEATQEARLEELERRSAGTAPAPAAPGGPATDIAAQLQQLAELRNQDVLSPEEFETAKQKLLAG